MNNTEKAKEIVAKHRQIIELHAFSAAYAITPTLVNFYRESVADTVTIKDYYITAIENAIYVALGSEPRKEGGLVAQFGEYTALFRFQARVRLYQNSLSFDLNFVMNGGNVQLES